MRDRLWKRRIREGLAKPYIPKEEVEKEMRNPKSPKSDASPPLDVADEQLQIRALVSSDSVDLQVVQVSNHHSLGILDAQHSKFTFCFFGAGSPFFSSRHWATT